MKVARFFAVIFGILGLLVMLGTAGLCFAAIDLPTQVAQVPQAGLDCAKEMMDAIALGDLETASARMYGQPDLGAARVPEDPDSAKLWQAFLGSFSYEFLGPCYATDVGFARDALVSVLDVSAILDGVDGYAREMLQEHINTATEMAELYDETGEFRQDLMDSVMVRALDKAMAEDGRMLTAEVTLGLIYRDGAWWVVPDAALLKLLAGGI